MDAKYVEGQRVRIVDLFDSRGWPDRQIKPHVGKIGTVVKSYCVSRDEISGVEKMFDVRDVYCYDIWLDEYGVVLPGIPEVALEPCN